MLTVVSILSRFFLSLLLTAATKLLSEAKYELIVRSTFAPENSVLWAQFLSLSLSPYILYIRCDVKHSSKINFWLKFQIQDLCFAKALVPKPVAPIVFVTISGRPSLHFIADSCIL